VKFDNSFLAELPADAETGPRLRDVHAAWSSVTPTPVAAPRLIAHAREVAALLGLDEAEVADPRFAAVFAGNALYPGMQTYATAYGGHQFGHWAGQLGDGRVIGLGEAIGGDGRRWELQLKGAGPTPFSRRADGRAVLRSSIREFLCSEAMHHLGVPTTRALCLVGTGEMVERDMFYDGHPRDEPGAVVCRVAPSFIRFGHFELPTARGDIDLLRAFADFTIRHHYPHIGGEGETRLGDWFGEICERTARMVAAWMRVGFVHGVMNTDNLSILGLTLDYGPYGWIDDYDPEWTPNTTDRHHGRYRFGQQPRIAHWNLACLAHALSPLFAVAEPLQAGLVRYAESYAACERADIAAKLGLAQLRDDDGPLVADLHAWLRTAEVDMTLFFRNLADLDPARPDPQLFEAAFYDESRRAAHAATFDDWLARYAARLGDDPQAPDARRAAMRQVNPRYVLRNYLAQQAIDRAEQGDESMIHELLDLLRRPYDDQPERDHYAARRPDWARTRAGCSMLSCSS